MTSTVIDGVMLAVIDLMNDTQPFAPVTRGALGAGNSIVCEIGPTGADAVFMDKNSLIPLDVTLNGKHRRLKVVTDAMNRIHLRLTRARTDPAGIGWQIVDIRNGMLPEIIGREQNNDWLLASSLTVLYHWKGE
jgi:hypothetical protein